MYLNNKVDFRGEYFTGNIDTSFRNKHFYNCYFYKVKFDELNMYMNNFHYCYFFDCKFDDLKIRDCSFGYCNFSGCDFTFCDFTKCHFGCNDFELGVAVYLKLDRCDFWRNKICFREIEITHQNTKVEEEFLPAKTQFLGEKIILRREED